MSREMRMWIVIGVAVLTATAAAILVVLFAPKPVEAKKTFVAVAKKDLEMGTTVSEADVKLVSWPQDNQVAGAFATTQEVKDKPLVARVLANEPFTKSKLADPANPSLLAKIEPGMRAISVKVNEVIGVAGFVTPGVNVDVLVTLNQDRESLARIIVRNVKVLTAGAKVDDPETARQGKPIPSTVVTLMVKPDDAELISLASTQGQITLALRNSLDKEMPATPGARKTKFFEAEIVKAAATPPPPPAPRPSPVGGRKPPPSTSTDAKPIVLPPPLKACFEMYKAGKREVVCE